METTMDFDHRAGSLEDLGRLVGGRIAPWGVAPFCTSVGSRRSDCRRRAVISRAQETQAVPGGLTGAQPAAAIGVPVDACIAS